MPNYREYRAGVSLHRCTTVDKDLPVAATSKAAGEEPPPPAQRLPIRRNPPSKLSIHGNRQRTNVLPERHALDMDSSQPQMASPERKQSVPSIPTTPTPSEWPASQPSSRHHLHVSDMDVDAKPDSEPQPEDVSISQEVAFPAERQPAPSSKPSSHLSAPTPAQRPKPLSPSVSSSPLKGSSAPRPSIQTPSHPLSSPRPSLPIHMRRRVPYPTPPVPPDPDISGFGRILVPNSDTSGQSQSQSQAYSERQHASQPNFFSITSQDGSCARTNSQMPTSHEAEEPSQAPDSQPPVRPSQPESYDGDRSSPELSSQVEKGKRREHMIDPLSATYEAANGRPSSQRPQGHEPFESEVVEQEDSEEEVDQLQSDGEQPDDEGDHVEHSPGKDLSDDDAQIHAMLMRDSPQNGGPPELLIKLPARTNPTPHPSAKDDVERGDSSTTTTISRSPPVAGPHGSRGGSRAASPGRLSSSMAPPPPPEHQALKNAKIPKSTSSSSSIAVEHDLEAWKNPSFMRSARQGKAKPTVHRTADTTEINKMKFLPTASSSKALRPARTPLHGSDASASIKATSTKSQTSRASTPVVVAGPSRPNKRVWDRLSESSRSSSIPRGDSGSGSKTKKRKIEAGESVASVSSDRSRVMSSTVQMGVMEEPVKPEPRISSTGSGSGRNRDLETGGSGSRAAVGNVKDDPVKHEPRISSDASGSGNRKKRKIEASEPTRYTSSNRSGTAIGAETLKEKSHMINDTPATSESESRKKKRINVRESGGGVTVSGSTSSRDTSDPRREKVMYLHSCCKSPSLITPSRMESRHLCLRLILNPY